MGTRADFYSGRGDSAEWLGSIAWDGYPSGVFEGAELMLDSAVTLNEADWRKWVAEFLAGRSDATLPEGGWPWPWEDSRLTDCVYAWDGGKVWQAAGHPERWYPVNPDADCYGLPCDEDDPGDGPLATFPNMKDRQNVTFGPRSGVFIVGG